MAQSSSASNLAARLWNSLGGGVRRRLVWLAQPKFTLGVSGVVTDSAGQVLLLRHRFWKGQPWGLPGGSANHGETPAQTLQREVREETGLEVDPVAILRAGAGSRWRVEMILLARCADPSPAVRSVEIMEAHFWPFADLPADILPSHREILESFRQDSAHPRLHLVE